MNDTTAAAAVAVGALPGGLPSSTDDTCHIGGLHRRSTGWVRVSFWRCLVETPAAAATARWRATSLCFRLRRVGYFFAPDGQCA